MDKKLPKVFANRIERTIENNERIYVASKSQEEIEPKTEKQSVNQKIKTIFNSKDYIYKAEVEITTERGKTNKKIIGKNGNNLITIDNEIIPIDTILDIQLKNS